MLECTQILSVYKMYFSRLIWFQLYTLLADKIFCIHFYPGALLHFPSSVSSLCSGLDAPFQFVQLSLVYSTTPNLSLQKLNRVISLISESSTRMKTGRKSWLWNENRFGKNQKSTVRIIIILVKIKCSRITNQSWRLSTFQEETNEHFENDSSALQTVNISNFQLVLTVQ